MLKLGTFITDNATEIKGMLTMYSIDESGNQHYLFQPKGLNPETHHPVDTYWIGEKRVDGAVIISIELPLYILGTHVEDKATGFNGKAICINYHLNGCIHIEVKPKGIIEKNGEVVKAAQFDIRRLKGDAIKELSEEELEKSKRETPSPEYSPSLFNR